MCTEFLRQIGHFWFRVPICLCSVCCSAFDNHTSFLFQFVQKRLPRCVSVCPGKLRRFPHLLLLRATEKRVSVLARLSIILVFTGQSFKCVSRGWIILVFTGQSFKCVSQAVNYACNHWAVIYQFSGNNAPSL